MRTGAEGFTRYVEVMVKKQALPFGGNALRPAAHVENESTEATQIEGPSEWGARLGHSKEFLGRSATLRGIDRDTRIRRVGRRVG